MNKKIIGILICTLFIGTSIVPNIYGKIGDNLENRINTEMHRVSNKESNLPSFALVINNQDDNMNPDSENIIYESQLTEDQAVQLKKEIEAIDQKILATKNPDELKILGEQKLTILRDYNLIPDTFTIDNLNKLTEEIGKGLRKAFSANSTVPNKRILGNPYISVGPSVFAYISLWGFTKPFGFSPNGSYGSPIIKLSKINLQFNYTGIYVNVTGPFPILHNGYIEINNSMWKSLWANYKDQWLNYTEYHLMTFYYGELMIGRCISFGYAFPDFYNPPSRNIVGSFFYFGSPTFPISMTLYQTWPQPPTVLLDFNIVTSLFFSVILPFWYPDPSIT